MVKKNRIRLVLAIAASAILFTFPGCKKDPRKHPDVKGSEVKLKINRLEDDIMSVRSPEEYVALDLLDTLFILQYKTQIMGPVTGEGYVPPQESARGFVEFTSNKDMQDLYANIQKKYPDLKKEEKELSKAFTYFHYYFPKRTIPRLVTFMAPFSAATATSDETLAIGLDMYLGTDFEPYYSPNLQTFPQYKINRCRRDYIVPNAVKAWLLKEFEIDDNDRRLLNQMIYEGKILYAMDLLLPDMADSLKIGYAKGKIEWCEHNEGQIWNHIVSNDLLYSNEYQKFSGILTDGPFSKGMNVPPDSPPMIAVWAGWQIVRKYMEKNPEVSLKQLMDEKDSDKILKGSGYRP
ncbi:MAG: hypothetical protein GC181_13690 [Bacteroidetes bacterium]|nr:hypothetical protein [Bacteroidota bacterium]